MKTAESFNTYSFAYLKEERKVTEDNIIMATKADILKIHDIFVEFKMRDINGEVVGTQKRWINPSTGSPKSYAKKGSRTGYFFMDSIDFEKEILITEGELDYLTVCNLPNTIGLQGVGMLKKLLHELQTSGAKKIVLLVDNDDGADKAIESAINDEGVDTSILWDARKVLKEFKDVNELYQAGETLNREKIVNHAVSIEKGITSHPMQIENRDKEEFYEITTKGKKLNHNLCAKHMVKSLYIKSSKENCFQYSEEEGIRKQLTDQNVMKLIMNMMEKELQVTNIDLHDRNKIYEFLLTHAEDALLTKHLQDHIPNMQRVYLKNCIYNMLTDESKQYMPEEYIFSKLPYTLEQVITAKVPERRLTFLDEILEGRDEKQEIIDFLQEFVGYLFIPTSIHEKALLIYGSGCNGKGVLMSVMRHILGQGNVADVGMHEITKEQNLLLLVGKLANFDTDMNHRVQIDNGTIKKIVSGEAVTVKAVYERPFNFAPYARIIIGTNNLPHAASIDNSVRRRFIFLHLKKNFIDKKDPLLKEKLYEEHVEIFSWAIQGLKRLIERGDFIIPDSLQDDLEEFMSDADSISAFIDSGSITIEKGRFTPYALIDKQYSDFCKQNGFTPASRTEFHKILSDRGFTKARRNTQRGFADVLLPCQTKSSMSRVVSQRSPVKT